MSYIISNGIEGDFVECGVWKGGNILGICSYLSSMGIENRSVWLYDTFSGMTEPKEEDIDYTGTRNYPLCDVNIESVKSVVDKSNYSKESMKYIVGDVCETLSDLTNIPQKIALLRLDTDWYDSTKKELDVLYDCVVQGGVIIIDDYGHWQGCKKAVDEFFDTRKITPNIEKIDYTGIKIIKN